MSRGEIVEAGATRRIFAAPAHSYTRHLLAAEPRPMPRAPRADAPIVLEADDVRVWFPIRRGAAATHGRPHQGGRRREPDRARGPDGRRGGRERLGQDHARPGAAAAAAGAGPDPRGRARDPGALRAGGAAAAARDAGGLPGSVRCAVAAHVDRADRGRRPRRARHRRHAGRATRRSSTRRCARWASIPRSATAIPTSSPAASASASPSPAPWS